MAEPCQCFRQGVGIQAHLIAGELIAGLTVLLAAVTPHELAQAAIWLGAVAQQERVLDQMGQSTEVAGIGKAAHLDFQGQCTLTSLGIGHQCGFQAIFQDQVTVVAMVEWRLGNGMGQ